MRAPDRGESLIVDDVPRALAGGDPGRIASLDFVRGVAVLGILFANITGFAHPMLAYYWPPALGVPANETDKVFWLFQFIVIDGKMRGLFTLLFGAGMALFMERAWARGDDRTLQLHRLLWLFAFGSAHYFLLWRGDILALYAVWGIAALPFMRRSARTLLATGLTLYLVGSVLSLETGLQRLAAWTPLMEHVAVERALAERATVLQSSYGSIVASDLPRRIAEFVDQLGSGLGETLPLILVGMAFYRFGLFSGRISSRTLARWGWAGVLAGTVLTAPLGLWLHLQDYPLSLTEFVFIDAAQAARLPAIVGLAALLAAIAPRVGSSAFGGRITAAGRLALTNYLGTSVVMTALFNGWGLGLFGSLHRAALFGIVLLAWTVMLVWSPLWLRHFGLGPCEWLWRCLTYRQWPTLRRTTEIKSPVAIAIDSH